MPTRGVPRRRKTYRRKGNTKMRAVARQEAKKVVAKAIESKSWDGVLTATGIDYGGAVYNLFANPAGATVIAQGLTDESYIGNWVKPTYIMLRGQWAYVDPWNLVRLVVVQVKGGGTPTAANLWQSVSNIRAPLSPLDRDYDQTYTVLADRSAVVDNANRYLWHFKIKISGKKLRKVFFNDAAGTVEANGIYVLLISDSGVSSHPEASLEWRVHYKDA